MEKELHITYLVQDAYITNGNRFDGNWSTIGLPWERGYFGLQSTLVMQKGMESLIM